MQHKHRTRKSASLHLIRRRFYYFLFYSLLLVSLTHCQSETLPTIIPSMQPGCGDFLIPMGSDVRCEQLTAGSLAITSRPDTQLTLSLKNAAITLNGSLYAITDTTRMQIVNIRGTVIVSIGEQTHILTPGMMIALMPAAALTFDSVSGIAPYQAASETTIQITPATALPSLEAASQDENSCQKRTDWTGEYTVRSGDNLTRIAGRFGITLLSLIRGNCLADPDRLREGQILNVPPLPTQTPDGIVRAPTATATRAAIAFRADRNLLESGDCTTLRWDVFDVDTLFLNDEPIAFNDVLRVCPEDDTDYTLRVVYADGEETERILTIIIE